MTSAMPPQQYLAEFVVHGVPGPQGSKSPTGRMRPTKNGGYTPVMRESSRKVAPWRKDVAEAATKCVTAHRHRPWFPLDGPLVAVMVFAVPAPARKPAGQAPAAADRKPDLSKLCRSTEDALTGILWSDDARVIGYDMLWKQYPHPGGVLTQPGAFVAVRRATHAELGLHPDTRDGRKYTDLLTSWQSVTAADRHAAALKALGL